MAGTCQPSHDIFSDLLTGGLILGLFISYAPQHARIIKLGSSEGINPWFLLLGSTSAASGMLNMIIMQWGVLKCCKLFSFGDCLETVAGVVQVIVQWFLFTVIMVLYMIYYPPHLKYGRLRTTAPLTMVLKKANHWSLSVILCWVVLIHLIFIVIVSFLFISASPSDPSGTVRSPQLSSWATFLGLSSGFLAALQYGPQLVHTYRTKLVGALSIPMMMIQTPGGFIMVLSIALRPGTNWTSWIQFLVAAIMQAILLTMCIAWKYRQTRLGIDDFGQPSVSCVSDPHESTRSDAGQNGIGADEGTVLADDGEGNEESPLLGGREAHK